MKLWTYMNDRFKHEIQKHILENGTPNIHMTCGSVVQSYQVPHQTQEKSKGPLNSTIGIYLTKPWNCFLQTPKQEKNKQDAFFLGSVSQPFQEKRGGVLVH